MPIEVRKAPLQDAPAIAALHARSWRATYRGAYRDDYLDGPVDDERLQVWTTRLTDPPPNQFVVVAKEDGRLLGFACAYGGHDPEWGSFLDNIHVDPLRRSEGIGTKLFTAVVEWCRDRYPEHGLHLQVLSQNDGARRFYEALGAVDRGNTPTSNRWVLEGVEIRRYAWKPLPPAKSGPKRRGQK